MAAFQTFSRLRAAFGAAAALGVAGLLFHFVAGDTSEEMELREKLREQLRDMVVL
jgi:hypothetical protein